MMSGNKTLNTGFFLKISARRKYFQENFKEIPSRMAVNEEKKGEFFSDIEVKILI